MGPYLADAEATAALTSIPADRILAVSADGPLWYSDADELFLAIADVGKIEHRPLPAPFGKRVFDISRGRAVRRGARSRRVTEPGTVRGQWC